MPVKRGTLPKAIRAVRGNPALQRGTDVNDFDYNIEFDRIYFGNDLKFDRWSSGWFWIRNDSNHPITFKAQKIDNGGWTAAAAPVLQYIVPGSTSQAALSYNTGITIPAGKMICLKNTNTNQIAQHSFSKGPNDYIRFDLSSSYSNQKITIGGSIVALVPQYSETYTFIGPYALYRLFYTSSSTTGIPSKFIATIDPDFTLLGDDNETTEYDQYAVQEMFAGSNITNKNGIRSCPAFNLRRASTGAFKATFKNSMLGSTVSGILDTAEAPDIIMLTCASTGQGNGTFCETFMNCTNILTGPRICRPSNYDLGALPYAMFTAMLYVYESTFEGCTGMTSVRSQNIYPMISNNWLETGAFYRTFKGCTALQTPPFRFGSYTDESTYLANNSLIVNMYGFYETFMNCSSLSYMPYGSYTNGYLSMHANFVPKLRLSKDGYNCERMFYGCTSLNSSDVGNHVPQFPGASRLRITFISSLTAGCKEMFYGCTSLTNMREVFDAPMESQSGGVELCSSMFQNCTSLQYGSVPPIRSASASMFKCAFKGCTQLRSIKGFNLETTYTACCSEMFYGCTTMTTSPVLTPELVYDGGSTTSNDAYYRMFYGCSSLNLIITNQATGNGNGTTQWTYDLPTTGKYVKLNLSNTSVQQNQNNNTSAPHYIPFNWTIQSGALDFRSDSTFYVTLSKSTNFSSSLTFYYINLSAANPTQTTYTIGSQITINANGHFLFWGETNVAADFTKFSVSADDYFYFTLNGSSLVDCYGSLASLYKFVGSRPVNQSRSYRFTKLFKNCTKLRTAPVLPQFTSLTSSGYNYSETFSGCTNLQTTPSITTTFAGAHEFSGALRYCNSLTVPPDLSSVTTMDIYCFEELVRGCTSLEGLPVLPASTVPLAKGCFYAMMYDCSAVTEVPEGYLPWTTLAEECYRKMFEGCSNLLTVDYNLLPTIGTSSNPLPFYCYCDMFARCSQLEVAPNLPSTSIANGCYAGMFSGCTNLREMSVSFTAWDNAWGLTYARSTDNWTRGIAVTDGNFKCPSSLPAYYNNSGNQSSSGNQGGNTSTTPAYIPYGWTKNNGENPIPPTSRFQFIYKSGAVTIGRGTHFTTGNAGDLEYSRDGYTWYDFTSAQTVNQTNRYLCIRAKTTVAPLTSYARTYFTFSGSGKVDVRGNVSYLFNSSGLTYGLYCVGLFRNCSNISDCESMYFNCSYVETGRMFEGSTVTKVSRSLLSAVIIENAALMFQNCYSLTQGADLVGMNSTYSAYCFHCTYFSCTSLVSTAADPLKIGKGTANNDGDGAFMSVFQWCNGSNFKAVFIESRYLAKKSTGGYSNSTFAQAFSGCTNLNAIYTKMVRWPDYNVTDNWVLGLGASGTFYHTSDLTTYPHGNSRIPTGWSHQQFS